jgi:hypothetical protein
MMLVMGMISKQGEKYIEAADASKALPGKPQRQVPW